MMMIIIILNNNNDDDDDDDDTLQYLSMEMCLFVFIIASPWPGGGIQ